MDRDPYRWKSGSEGNHVLIVNRETTVAQLCGYLVFNSRPGFKKFFLVAILDPNVNMRGKMYSGSGD